MELKPLSTLAIVAIGLVEALTVASLVGGVYMMNQSTPDLSMNDSLKETIKMSKEQDKVLAQIRKDIDARNIEPKAKVNENPDFTKNADGSTDSQVPHTALVLPN